MMLNHNVDLDLLYICFHRLAVVEGRVLGFLLRWFLTAAVDESLLCVFFVSVACWCQVAVPIEFVGTFSWIFLFDNSTAIIDVHMDLPLPTLHRNTTNVGYPVTSNLRHLERAKHPPRRMAKRGSTKVFEGPPDHSEPFNTVRLVGNPYKQEHRVPPQKENQSSKTLKIPKREPII